MCIHPVSLACSGSLGLTACHIRGHFGVGTCKRIATELSVTITSVTGIDWKDWEVKEQQGNIKGQLGQHDIPILDRSSR